MGSDFLPMSVALVSSCLPLASLLWPSSRAPWLSGHQRSCCAPVLFWERLCPVSLGTPALPLTGAYEGLDGVTAWRGRHEGNSGLGQESSNSDSISYLHSWTLGFWF